VIGIKDLNILPLEEFVRRIGPVFEQSPWIASATWARRPFASVQALNKALVKTVLQSNEEQQLALIRAHPDLAGRAAQTGSLTPESASEQFAAGLNQLTAVEKAEFQALNQDYKSRFGFPFILCARLNRKDAMLAGLRKRATNSRAQEIKTALDEITKIAYLRLQDTVCD
jgi:2-oxo-4-hydroxy-4-carboxy-5-ureidoimidazoline decarboxylase